MIRGPDFAPGEFALGAGPLLEWVRRSANIVAGYYGRFPTARLELISGAGHFPHWEQPEEFVQRLSAFVDDRNA